MHSLKQSLLSSLKFPADISAGIQALNLLRSEPLYEGEKTSSPSTFVPTLPDKKHVHSSDAARKGYLEALNYIHETKPSFSVETLFALHERVFYYLDGSGGHFKKQNNTLFNHKEDGTQVLVHTPIDAENVPVMMDKLIHAFYDAIQTHDPLVVVPLTLMDFILIHPFWDGNGRMFRLLSVLLLYQAGFDSVRKLNVDYILQNSRGSGQTALSAGVDGWRQSTHNVVPWVTYFVGALSYAHAHHALTA